MSGHGTRSRYSYWRCRCAVCRRAQADRSREWRARKRGGYVQERIPLDVVVPLAQRLVHVHGSVKRAGLAYSERHGLAPTSGERLLLRLLHGSVQTATPDTLDRLEVMT